MVNQHNTSNRWVVWRLLDGKPGHEHQSQGLVQAVQALTATQVVDITVTGHGLAWMQWLAGTWSLGAGLPAPDLIIGAGHQTHWHMLAAQKAYGGKTICLMQPSLPVQMFDLCLIPEHDAYRGWGSYIETRGVLNHIRAGSYAERDARKGLILVGGPSRHFIWDEASVLAQVVDVVRQQPEMDFVLTTSRRTPASFVRALRALPLRQLKIVPIADTDAHWVQRELSRASTAWVTEDSVSMVYEGLTAQVAVGLINLAPQAQSRVLRGMSKLVDRNIVTRYDPYGLYRQHLHAVIGFNEAHRCAELLLRHLVQADGARQPRLVARLS